MTMSIFAIISLDDLCVSIRIFMKFRLVIILTAFLGGLAVMHYKLAGVGPHWWGGSGGVQLYFVDPFSPLAHKGRADTLSIAPCFDSLSRGRSISLRLDFKMHLPRSGQVPRRTQ